MYLLVNGTECEGEVLAAFSTHEAAQAAHRFGGWRSAIQEVVVDPQLPTAPDGHSLWHTQEFQGVSAVRITAFHDHELDVVEYDGVSYDVNLWATDEEHALRSGIERIDQYKKEQGAIA